MLVCSAFCVFRPSFVYAIVTQDEVFRSIKDNVSEAPMSGRTLLAFLAATVALVLLLSLFSVRQKRQVKPKILNHPGKLVKELIKQASLRPAEVKQLRILAESGPAGEKPVQNPLVLLLCPSVLKQRMRTNPPKVDRKVVAGLARKLGLVQRGKEGDKGTG